MLLETLKLFTPKDTPKKKTKAQIQKEKNEYERLLWERAEEYEDYDEYFLRENYNGYYRMKIQ